MIQNWLSNNILIEIENESEKLKRLISDSNSSRLKLISISDFFERLITTENKNLIDANIPQFISEYQNCLSIFDPICIPVKLTNHIIKIARELCALSVEYIDSNAIIKQILMIEKRLDELTKMLNAENIIGGRGLFFPVLEESYLHSNDNLGLLESLTVQIHKAKNQTKFLIIPSPFNPDSKLLRQIDDSWINAIKYLEKNKIKLSQKWFEVLISFDRKEGVIVGNSLGIVLTLTFLEELLKFLNASLIVDTKDNIAITGGLDENGNIVCTSREIIRIKTETVFYSTIQTFCIPKVNEIAVEEKLYELKKEFPNRNLEVVGLSNLNDLLNRRNIVEIRKQKLIVKTRKFIKANWKSAIATVLLAILFAYLFVMDFDDNPASLSSDGVKLYIKNKSGKILWSKETMYGGISSFNTIFLNSLCRVVDVNNDKVNEVLISHKILDINNPEIDMASLTCLDYKGNVIWIHKFEETVSSKRENLDKFYGLLLIDTLTIKNKLVLFLNAGNQSSFSSAIYPINLSNGKKLKGTFWCSGHIEGAFITDYNNDGKNDIVAVGADNGYEQQVLFAFEIDTMNVSRKTIDDYFILNYPEAKTLAYVRFPKTDFDNYVNTRIPGVGQGSFFYDNAKEVYKFSTVSEGIGKNIHLWIEVKKDFSDVNVIVDNQYRVLRDTLVAKGKLHLPYTDTKAFIQDYKNKILYLNEYGEWINKFAKMNN